MKELGHPMHQTTVAKLEKGERPVRVDEAFGLARLLDVRLPELFVDDADPRVLARERDRVSEAHQRARYVYAKALGRYDAARAEAEAAFREQERASEEVRRLEWELDALDAVEADRD